MLRQNIKSQSYQGVHRHLALLDYAAMRNYISSQMRTPSFIVLDFCTRFFWYISGGLKKIQWKYWILCTPLLFSTARLWKIQHKYKNIQQCWISCTPWNILPKWILLAAALYNLSCFKYTYVLAEMNVSYGRP